MGTTSTGATLEIGMNVRELDASVRFYRDVLGFTPCGTISLPQRRIAALRLNESVIKLVEEVEPLQLANPRVSHAERAYGFYALAFNVADAAAVAARCSHAGYEVERPFSPFPPEVKCAPGGGVACIRDADGNFIEIVQGLLWDEQPEDA